MDAYTISAQVVLAASSFCMLAFAFSSYNTEESTEEQDPGFYISIVVNLLSQICEQRIPQKILKKRINVVPVLVLFFIVQGFTIFPLQKPFNIYLWMNAAVAFSPLWYVLLKWAYPLMRNSESISSDLFARSSIFFGWPFISLIIVLISSCFIKVDNYAYMALWILTAFPNSYVSLYVLRSSGYECDVAALWDVQIQQNNTTSNKTLLSSINTLLQNNDPISNKNILCSINTLLEIQILETISETIINLTKQRDNTHTITLTSLEQQLKVQTDDALKADLKRIIVKIGELRSALLGIFDSNDNKDLIFSNLYPSSLKLVIERIMKAIVAMDEGTYNKEAANLRSLAEAAKYTLLHTELTEIVRSANILLSDNMIMSENTAKICIEQLKKIAQTCITEMEKIKTCSEILAREEAKENIKRISRDAAQNVIKNHEGTKQTLSIRCTAVSMIVAGIWTYINRKDARLVCITYVCPTLAQNFFNTILPQGEENDRSDKDTLTEREQEDRTTCAALWFFCE